MNAYHICIQNRFLCSFSHSLPPTDIYTFFISLHSPSFSLKYTYTLALSLSHSLALSYSLSCSHSQSISLTLSHSLWHIHMLSLSLSRSLSHALPLSLPLRLSHALSHSLSLKLYHVLTLYHTLSLSLYFYLSLYISLMFTLSRSLALSHSLTLVITSDSSLINTLLNLFDIFPSGLYKYELRPREGSWGGASSKCKKNFLSHRKEILKNNFVEMIFSMIFRTAQIFTIEKGRGEQKCENGIKWGGSTEAQNSLR